MGAQLSSLSIPVQRRQQHWPPFVQISTLRHRRCAVRAGIRRLFDALHKPSSAATVDPRRRHPAAEELVNAGLAEGLVDTERLPVTGRSSSTASTQLQQLVVHLIIYASTATSLTSKTSTRSIPVFLNRGLMAPSWLPAKILLPQNLPLPRSN